MNVLQVAPPRQVVAAERATLRNVKLYLSAGIPALPALRIMVWISAISRSRSGLRPKMMFDVLAAI